VRTLDQLIGSWRCVDQGRTCGDQPLGVFANCRPVRVTVLGGAVTWI